MPKFPGVIQSKLPHTGTTIFTVMSKLANEVGAINLSQGFPDFPCSEELVSLVNQAMKKGLNQYAPMPGLLELRETLSEKIQDSYSAIYNPDTEITITSGGTQALFTAISALVKEGDEVLLFEPCYDSYAPAIELSGGIPIYIQLKAPDFHIDWNEVKKMIRQKTKMIIINTPHNPASAILSAQDMLQLEKITKNTDIIILSDEVYEHLIFDKLEHQSVMRFPKLAERSLVVFSFGKTLHVTGWKMGYIVGPENLMKEFRKVHQFNVFSANHPFQWAINEFLKNKANYTYLPEFYQAKRDLFLKLTKESRFQPIECKGSYFQLMSYKNITEEKDTDFAIRLTKEFGVASIPISVFYHKPVDNKLLRFCFAKQDETLEKAAEKLLKV
ncbi:MAG: methionine aminotransferase [Bacteroidia bacterium]|nr:methionine aminotransferase [Bacteroidia bacterium]